MFLNTFTNWWNTIDPYVQFILAVFGIISFPLSFYFYFRSRQKKKITYSMNSVEVISSNNSINKLHISYEDKEVNNLRVTKIAFWNSGNLTVDKNDIAENYPVCIGVVSQESLYDIQITKASHTANDFKIEKIGSNRCTLSFSYIDPKEGCVIKALHSGKVEDLFIDGKIKGIRKFTVQGFYPKSNSQNVASKEDTKLTNIIWGIAFLGCLIGGFFKKDLLFMAGFFAILRLLVAFIPKLMPSDLEGDFRSSK